MASSSSSSASKIITLTSSDNETFEVEESILSESQTLKHMIDDNCTEDEIPLANVSSVTLSKVIQYCKKHSETTDADGDLKKWDAKFIKISQFDLFHLTIAAHYLEINSLMDLTCQTIADKVKEMSAKQINKYFNVENDFTPEEEEEIRLEKKRKQALQ